ncbi:hypothetical protein RHGRI_033517 [Rhododendron griersonianum]|uniref:Uncharacterized protein n=1 Tax=Rhododendron griersonianum TaxID=479676 RepID=A0AAV6I078_9ERIC|nr:hypothetical protein RHGRI_033517 [Rhododendron griersonianum]
MAPWLLRQVHMHLKFGTSNLGQLLGPNHLLFELLCVLCSYLGKRLDSRAGLFFRYRKIC